jgi:hypothetical protein
VAILQVLLFSWDRAGLAGLVSLLELTCDMFSDEPRQIQPLALTALDSLVLQASKHTPVGAVANIDNRTLDAAAGLMPRMAPPSIDHRPLSD